MKLFLQQSLGILFQTLLFTGSLFAQSPTAEPKQSPANSFPFTEEKRQASILKSLALLQKSGVAWNKNQTCFSCHHQPLPMLAMVESGKAGFKMDADWLKMQADLTHAYFQERVPTMKAGKHIAGGSATAAFGLWALLLDNRPADETTSAMVSYLLQVQSVVRSDSVPEKRGGKQPANEGAWPISCKRPPLNGSLVANTVLALIGMNHFATKEQRPAFEQALKKANDWLDKTPLRSTEDHVWRLWGIHVLSSDLATKSMVRKSLLAMQRPDGGWSQDKDLPSDAFSTGQALFVLRKTGTPIDDATVTKAVTYLLQSQYPDGSWLVETRVKPVQPDYDNGDPHGKHQFLSIAATSWAIAGLSQMFGKD